MCGRYHFTSPSETMRKLALQMDLPGLFDHLPVNAAPGQRLPVLLRQNGRVVLRLMRWGLIPRWAKERPANGGQINARSETIFEKPTFADNVRARRCLIPANGFFEWHEAGGAKQPWHIGFDGGEHFAFAGVWDSWVEPATGAEEDSFAIITTTATANIAHLHHRMPVMLQRDKAAAWLRTADPELLLPDAALPVTFHPVADRIGGAPAGDLSLLEPVPPKLRQDALI